MANLDVSHIKSLIESAKSVSILLTKNPSYDAVAAGLACKLALDTAGKITQIACETPMTVEFNRLVGVDSIDTNFGSRNLVISFHDQTEFVDKVSYNLDEGELRLLITPKAGAPDLDHRKLHFIPGRSVSDVIIVIDADHLDHLGQVYVSAKDAITKSKVISINQRPPADSYTPHQIYDPQSSSLSELMAKCIQSLNLSLHADVATNLLAGVESHTKNFQSPNVSPETFEVAALLLKRGAVRHHPLSAADFPTGAIPNKPFHTSSPAPQPNPPSNQSGFGTDSTDTSSDAPSEWYEPKIYRGPMLQ